MFQFLGLRSIRGNDFTICVLLKNRKKKRHFSWCQCAPVVAATAACAAAAVAFEATIAAHEPEAGTFFTSEELSFSLENLLGR